MQPQDFTLRYDLGSQEWANYLAENEIYDHLEIVPPTFDEGTGGAITPANASENQCYTCLGLAVDTGEDYYAKALYIDIGMCYNYNTRTYFYCIRNEFDCYVFD